MARSRVIGIRTWLEYEQSERSGAYAVLRRLNIDMGASKWTLMPIRDSDPFSRDLRDRGNGLYSRRYSKKV